MLQNQLRGDWRREDAVAANAQFDAVHRLIGRPGVVLVGEGAPQRVRGLIAQEKKRIARVAGDTPIYDIVVGNGEGEVPLAKLQPAAEPAAAQPVQGPGRRAGQAAAGPRRRRPPLPQGPMPAGAKMRNVQRAARRHYLTAAMAPAPISRGLAGAGPGLARADAAPVGAFVVDCLAPALVAGAVHGRPGRHGGVTPCPAAGA